MQVEKALLSLLPDEIYLQGDFSERSIVLNGDWLSPVLSQKISNHSPDGFNWGYSGSGPAQLALAILLEYWPVKAAVACYESFKFAFIATLPQADFETTVPLRKIIARQIEAIV